MTCFKVLRVFLIFCFFLFCLTFFLYSQQTHPDAKASPLSRGDSIGLIFKKSGEDKEFFASKTIKVLEDYSNYVLAEFSVDQKENIEKGGNRIEVLKDISKISLDTYTIDINKGEPEMPEDLKIKDYEQGKDGYYFVKFIGPIKDEWLEDLKKKDTMPLQYYPHFTYLVKMKSEKRKDVESLSKVKWVGVYQPAYKMSKELIEGLKEERKFNSEQLIVLIMKDSKVIPEIIKGIESLGGVIEQQYDVDFYTKCRVKIQPPFSPLTKGDMGVVNDIVKIPDVYWVEVYYKPELEDEVSDQIMAGNYTAGVPSTGYSSWLSSKGIDGTGVTAGIVDDGVDDTHPDLSGRVVSLDYGGGSSPDGHGHHVAGIVAGNGSIGTVDANGFKYGLGMAPNANIIDQPFLKSGASASYQQLVRDCVKTNGPNGQPGYVQNNSWGMGSGSSPGTNTTYESDEREYDIYVRDADNVAAGNQPLIICFSAGNDGDDWSPGSNYQTLTRPKAAKNIFVTGATNNYRLSVPNLPNYSNNIDHLAQFSSRGPAADGRIRPEFCSPGTWIASLRAGSDTLWGNIDANYRWCTGTSQASPHTVGAAALIVQWWKSLYAQNPSPACVKALLVNSAVDMNSAGDNGWETTTSPIPNNDEGWGRNDLKNIFDNSVSKVLRDNPQVFYNNSETYTLILVPDDIAKPMKVTLAWTDAPGAIGANPALVNNLNLVMTRGRRTYYGNNFSNGWSLLGGSPDSINNVESAYIQSPSGIYQISVVASALNGDGIPGNGDSTDQDFALVVCNAAFQSSNGIIDLDFPAYTYPDTITITLLDTDLQGAGSQNVTIGSSTETTPENVLLTETAILGIFTGSINTASGSPAPDGVLQIQHNDTITATYIDANDGKGGMNVTKTATATADCQGPVISSVNATNIMDNSATIVWNTDENSNSVVNYGTSVGSLSHTVSNSNLVTSHSVNLTGLTAGTVYYYEVKSADGIGNETTDNNGGDCYSFATAIKYIYFSDDLEPTQEAGWTHLVGVGTEDSWAVLSTSYYNSATHSWHANDESSITDDYLITPSVWIGSNAKMSFYHTYQLEDTYDGAVIEISTTGPSGTFTDLGSLITSGGYVGTISTLYSSPIPGRMAWTGGSLGTMGPVMVNLSSYAGSTINVRFRMASDNSNSDLGWYVDDIEIYALQPYSLGENWVLY